MKKSSKSSKPSTPSIAPSDAKEWEDFGVLAASPFCDFLLLTDPTGIIRKIWHTESFGDPLGLKVQTSLSKTIAPSDLPYFTILLDMAQICGFIPDRAVNLLDIHDTALAYRMKGKLVPAQDVVLTFEKDTIGAARLFEIGYQDDQYPGLMQVVPFIVDQAIYCQTLQLPLAMVLLQFDRSTVSKRDLILLQAWLKAWSIQGIGGFEFDSGRLANLCQWPQSTDQLDRHLHTSFQSLDIVSPERFEIQLIDLTHCDTALLNADPIKALYQILADHELQTLYSNPQQPSPTTQVSSGKDSRVDDYVDRQHFHILYQPVVSVPGLDIHHYEALARLKQDHDTESTIVKAEEMGLANELDHLICQKVLNELAVQAKVGTYPKTALNISAQSLINDAFIADFYKMIESSQLDPSHVLLEITETYTIRNFDKAANIVNDLRRHGHAICLDDVGSGSTSFQSFYNLEVDYAKIDGKCLHRAMVDERYMSILRSIMTICQELFITVIAEQVETQAHLEFVEWLGIKLGQGFLLGRPADLPHIQTQAPL